MQLIKKVFCFLLTNFYFGVCLACPPDDSSESESHVVNSKKVDQQEELADSLKENIQDDDLNVFICNIGQGNFVILRYNKKLVIIDAGNIIATPKSDKAKIMFEDYYPTHKEVFDEIFKGAELKVVIITHPDADHYNYLPDIFQLLKNKSLQKDFSKCSFFVSKNDEKNYKCLKSDELIGARIKNATIITQKNFKDANQNISNLLFNKEGSCISFLNPIEGKNLENNDLSLIVKVIYNGQSILFTGDATDKTLDAIWQKSKSSLNVNFLVAPHHGSSTEGSLLWPIYVNSLNPYNFAGAIFSAPLY